MACWLKPMVVGLFVRADGKAEREALSKEAPKEFALFTPNMPGCCCWLGSVAFGAKRLFVC